MLGAGGSAGLLKGTNWSLTSTGLRYSGFTTSVSCATSSFCVAVDQTGSMAVYNGSRWTDRPLAGVPNGVGLVSVSCPSVRFCMAVDDQNGLYASGTYVWNGTSWGPRRSARQLSHLGVMHVANVLHGPRQPQYRRLCLDMERQIVGYPDTD